MMLVTPGHKTDTPCWDYNHIFVSTYPRPLRADFYRPRRLDPRGARPVASVVADRGRWPRPGAKRTPNARRPKLHGPGLPTAGHRALGGDCRTAVPTVRRSQRPKAVDRKVSPPGAVQSKPQTPRAGRRREDGLAVTPIGRRPGRVAVPPRPRERPGPVGPFGPPASRATLTCGGAIWNEARARRRDNGQAERWLELCHSGGRREAPRNDSRERMQTMLESNP
jgi:hypothetical protein